MKGSSYFKKSPIENCSQLQNNKNMISWKLCIFSFSIIGATTGTNFSFYWRIITSNVYCSNINKSNPWFMKQFMWIIDFQYLILKVRCEMKMNYSCAIHCALQVRYCSSCWIFYISAARNNFHNLIGSICSPLWAELLWLLVSDVKAGCLNLAVLSSNPAILPPK